MQIPQTDLLHFLKKISCQIENSVKDQNIFPFVCIYMINSDYLFSWLGIDISEFTQ